MQVTGNNIYRTTSELALAYRVTRQAIWGWIRQGKLPALKLGSTYRINERDWQAFIGVQERESK